eukprot:GFUD01071212.1.p1 GENE.GFUD01071212.1~~GFUD01071212.1.p1  ORF type:complete len:178 (+),score=49.20 GFUD01071212.1:146-679(+)
MSDSKPGSEHNLNESNMPLLSEDGTEKAEKGGETFDNELEEKKDESTEKKKKDKKLKVPKEKPGYDHDNLDMTLRDSKGINKDIDLDFDDILAEPSTAHGSTASSLHSLLSLFPLSGPSSSPSSQSFSSGLSAPLSELFSCSWQFSKSSGYLSCRPLLSPSVPLLVLYLAGSKYPTI